MSRKLDYLKSLFNKPTPSAPAVEETTHVDAATKRRTTRADNQARIIMGRGGQRFVGPLEQPTPPEKTRFPHFMEIPSHQAGDFHLNMTKAVELHPYGAAVDIHSPENLAGMRMFMTEDKKAGYAVTPHGELTSVFSHPNSLYRNVAKHAAEHSVLMAGATHASAFDPALPEMYRKGGFEAVGHSHWNPDYKPAGWNDEKQGTPDVVYLAANREVAKPEARPYSPRQKGSYRHEGEDSYEGGMEEAKDIGENHTEALSEIMKRYPRN